MKACREEDRALGRPIKVVLLIPKREIIRRLGTSPAQLYRLLDTTNYRKSIEAAGSLAR